MKGIKTEVKTDWKNYAHMTNSRYFRTDKAWNLGYLDVSKGDKPLPYIDCDELKAMGGAINKVRIVALVLSEERRAA